jgi:hypothetical protein
MKNDTLYNCKSALNDLPIFAKSWIEKYVKQMNLDNNNNNNEESAKDDK